MSQKHYDDKIKALRNKIYETESRMADLKADMTEYIQLQRVKKAKPKLNRQEFLSATAEHEKLKITLKRLNIEHTDTVNEKNKLEKENREEEKHRRQMEIQEAALRNRGENKARAFDRNFIIVAKELLDKEKFDQIKYMAHERTRV